MFFRRVPDGGGYAVMAGLQQFIDAVDHLKFTGEDIDYLRSTKAFDEKFLTYLANFKLHCNIWAIEEGMPNAAARHLQPPVPDRHQGEPHRALRRGPPGHGVRCPPRARV